MSSLPSRIARFVRGLLPGRGPTRPVYTCATCDQEHPGVPTAFFIPWPDIVGGLDVAERRERWESDGELGIVDDGDHFFVRANLAIPVHGADGDLVFTIWGSLSAESFESMQASWLDPARVDEPPYFSFLSNELPGFSMHHMLKANLRQQPVGERPVMELESTDHPLSVAQREGISLHELSEWLSENYE